MLAAVLLTYVMLFVDAAASDSRRAHPTTPPGVAALLEVGAPAAGRARRRASRPGSCSPRAKEGLTLGMRAWLKEHGDEIDPRDTFFVNVTPSATATCTT